MTPPPAATLAALSAFVAAAVAQRLAELVVSAGNARRLAARGGRRVPGDGFRLIVVVHTLYPVLLVTEVLAGGARPGADWPVWCAVWGAAQLLRFAAMRALGDRWTVGVWVVPGEPRVTRGPYRWLEHPNYLAVVAELAAGPLVFGAWRTALVVSALDAVALARRLRVERRALAESV